MAHHIFKLLRIYFITDLFFGLLYIIFDLCFGKSHLYFRVLNLLRGFKRAFSQRLAQTVADYSHSSAHLIKFRHSLIKSGHDHSGDNNICRITCVNDCEKDPARLTLG